LFVLASERDPSANYARKMLLWNVKAFVVASVLRDVHQFIILGSVLDISAVFCRWFCTIGLDALVSPVRYCWR